MTKADRLIQMGVAVTQGLGAGSQPEIGRAAAEETIDEITDHLSGAHMAFITAGMGGGTGTGAAPIVARAAREAGILTVGVVTKPFQFEGQRRMRVAEAGIIELQKHVDTLIVIPNQNLFRIANDKTTFADAFAMADEVLYSGVACITDLMVKDGLINLDFADVRSVMREMGKAMMGTGEASGDKRAIEAAEKAISNPLLDDVCMRGARGLLISITGGRDMTLFEVDEAASRVREEVEPDANIIFGATFDEGLEGIIRVSVVATGIEQERVAGAGRAAHRRHGRAHAPAEVGRRARRRRGRRSRCHAAAAARDAFPPTRWKDWSRSSPARSRSMPQQRALAAAHSAAAPRRAAQARAAGDPPVKIGPFRPDPSLVATRHARGGGRARARQRGGARAGGDALHPAGRRAPGGDAGAHAARRGLSRRWRSASCSAQPAAARTEEERRPRGLLARLTSGLTRRDEEEPEPAPRASAAEQPDFRTSSRAPRRTSSRRSQRGHARVGVRQARRSRGAWASERRGRQPRPARAARSRPSRAATTHLEIPAFLRRQTN